MKSFRCVEKACPHPAVRDALCRAHWILRHGDIQDLYGVRENPERDMPDLTGIATGAKSQRGGPKGLSWRHQPSRGKAL